MKLFKKLRLRLGRWRHCLCPNCGHDYDVRQNAWGDYYCYCARCSSEVWKRVRAKYGPDIKL